MLSLAVASCFAPQADEPLPSEVVDVAASDSLGDAQFRVGLNADGIVCAEVGSDNQRQASCGHQDGLSAIAFQADDGLALAGVAPMETTGALAALLEGERRVGLELTPMDEEGVFAFGLVVAASPSFVEIEILDRTGELAGYHTPSIGPHDPPEDG